LDPKDEKSFKTLRADTIDIIDKKIQKCPVILIRAPPYSGKSSLASLLKNHYEEKKEKAYFLDFLAWSTESDIEIYFEEQLKISWKKLWNADKKYLILDETQIMYQYRDSPFWKMLKHITASEHKKNYKDLKIITFAAYGSPNSSLIATPFAFETCLGQEIFECPQSEVIFYYQCILNQKQLTELVKDFSKVTKIVFSDSDKLMQSLRKLTGGHIGFFARTLIGIARDFSPGMVDIKV
jgi:energy-coupling factor transporter ATP-binding protein EcfA2